MRAPVILIPALAATLCMVSTAVLTYAQDSTRNQIEKEKIELEKLRRDIELQRRKTREIGRRAGSVLSDIQEIDGRLSVKERERRLAVMRYDQKNSELTKIEREVQKLTETLDRQRESVSMRLRALYKQRRAGVVGLLLTAKEPHDLLKRTLYIRRLANADQELFEGFTETLRSLEGRKDELTRARESYRQIKIDVEQSIRDVRAERNAKGRILARIKAEKKLREKTIEELKESSQQIQSLIQTLEKKRRAAVPPPSSSSKDGGITRGTMFWPADGKVVASYGKQRHPMFDFPVFRKGIEIAAGSNGMVRAAFDGVVSYADWFRGYGLLVIIDHGETYYSLYGHNAKLFVSVGDRVRTGQAIAEVGDTGLSQGQTVYFEIRRGTEALNPLDWLRPR